MARAATASAAPGLTVGSLGAIPGPPSSINSTGSRRAVEGAGEVEDPVARLLQRDRDGVGAGGQQRLTHGVDVVGRGPAADDDLDARQDGPEPLAEIARL